jgi:hypothetical protein
VHRKPPVARDNGACAADRIIDSDEDLRDNPKLAQMTRIKSQVRLWGYEAKATQKQQQLRQRPRRD